MHRLESKLSTLKRGQKGYSLVELMLVMMLLLLFGITIFTLIFSGSDTYQRISSNQDTESDIRIALSYLNVKIRQNDVTDTIEIRNFPGTQKPALILHDPREDSDLVTWIFWEGGQLLECLVSEGEMPSSDLSFTIVAVDDFDIAYDSQTRIVTGTVRYTYNEQAMERFCKVLIRSGMRGEPTDEE